MTTSIATLTIADIKTESTCDCYIERIEFNGINSQPVMDGNECWYSQYVKLPDGATLEYIQHEGYVLTDADNKRTEYSRDDNPLMVPEAVLEEMHISETAENPSHDMERIWTNYLEELPIGTAFYRDSLRGFANEYVNHIYLPDADIDEIDEDWDVLTLEEIASDLAYNGDDATDAYTGFRLHD